jgi:uncharacterized repeat protein (TIGR02543 family)
MASLLNTVVAVLPVQAVPGTLTEDFTTASLFSANKWVSTSSGAFGAHPCLTALNDSNPAIALSQSTTLPGCSNNPDVSGSGSLFLTSNDNQQAGTMLYNQALSTTGGLDISFFQAQYGGTGADGISFFVKDGTKTDLTVGQPGGNLGYKGIPGALFAVGFDSYGNWMNQGYGDSACTNNILGGVPKALAVRGPDTSVSKDGTSGFCILPGGFVAPNGAIGSDYFGTGSDTRTSAARPVRILVDPSTYTNPKIRVYMWKSGSLTQDLTTAPIQLTVDQPAEYKAAGTFKFGFSSSTGGAKDIHAIWGLEIAPLDASLLGTVYVVADNVTVRAGEAAIYTWKFYSDAAKTVEIPAGTLAYSPNLCSSTYTLSTNYPATLPITCPGSVYLWNTVATPGTLTVVRGTPSISPATNTITGNSGTAIISTSAYTARNFLYPQDLGYTISPPLPVGLSINATTGVISGTTAVVGTSTHTVTARSLLETATATVTITIAAPLTFAYSITYDKGTGTAGTLAPQTGTAATVTLSAFSTSTMVKPGYTFSGWLGSNTVSYTDAQVLSITGALTVTLTAQWTANSSRTVTYLAGTGTGTVPVQPSVLQGATFTVAAGTGLTNPGYTFGGWKDAGNTLYAAASTFTVAAIDVVLTAQWTANSSRTVTYSAGTGTGIVPVQPNVLQGATFTVAAGTGLTNPGYTFGGWKDATEIAYAVASTYTVAATNVVLTAQWSTTSQSVTYVANGATGAVPTQATVATGGTFVVAAGATLTKAGYTFSGWKDATDTAYAAGATFTMGVGNVTLTAQWSPTSQSITYVANTATGTVPIQANVATAATFVVAAGTSLTKPGYTFSGWKDASDTAYAAGATFTMGSTNVILTAQWSANPLRTITYSAGTGTGTVPTQVDVLQGATFVVAAGTSLTKAGYTFAGWKDAGNVDYAAASTFTVAATNIILTAQWTPTSQGVTYISNGATGTVPTQANVVTAATFTVASASTLAKAGSTFTGWKDSNGVDYLAGSTYTMGITNVTLTAQWQVNTFAYAISYEANGGTGTMAGQTGTGTSVTLSTNTFTRTGFTFTGWKDDASVTYTNAQVINLTATTSLAMHAQWVENTFPYAISFDANGGTGTMAGQTGVGASVKLTPNAFTRTGFTFTGWKDDASVAYTNNQSITLTATTTLALHAQWLADKPVEPVLIDKIISIAPTSGYANDQIIITGEFNHVITSISVGGLLLPANSWTQSKTTVTFLAPGHDVGKVDIKLINGLTPELPTQQFEYLKLTDLKIGIDGIKCLGTFDKACSLKPGAVQPVSFQLASNALSAKSIKTLKSWKLQTAKQVIIYGYASPEGSKALNDKLTKKRAAEVGAWVKKNWPNLSVKTVGLGTTVNRLCKSLKNRCAMIKIVSLKK